MRDARLSILARIFMVMAIVAAIGYGAIFCSTDGQTGPETFVVSLSMYNQDVAPVHLFAAEGETFPCCQVAPGGRRSVVLEIERGRSHPIWAGRNGESIANATCLWPTGVKGINFVNEAYWNGESLWCIGG